MQHNWMWCIAYKTIVLTIKIKENMSEIICNCFDVSKEEIEKAIKEKGLKTVDEVGEATNAGTGCGGCQEKIQEILDAINS